MGSTARQKGSGGKWKITGEIKKLVEEQMRRDDKTTACQLHSLLTREGHRLSLSTVLRCRSQLDSTYIIIELNSTDKRMDDLK